MRKHRKWLMGLGIGIVLGACMLQLINFAEAQDQQILTTGGSLTTEELEQAAKQQGMVLRPADEKTYSQQQLDEAVSKAVAGLPKSAASTENADSKTNAKNGSVKLYIKYNTSLEEAAWKLEALEVITDADDFISKAFVIRKKLAIGTSTFQGQPSYKQIMAELTRAKND